MQPVIYVEKYDGFKDEIFLRYFVAEETLERYQVGKKELFPTHAKWVRDTFLDRTFILQRLVWLPLTNIKKDNLSCFING